MNNEDNIKFIYDLIPYYQQENYMMENKSLYHKV